jgi:hypothetical protein
MHYPIRDMSTSETYQRKADSLVRTLSPELQLAIACCRFPPGPATANAISIALERPLNWATFNRIVQRHRIASLVSFNLSQSGHGAPAEVRESLAAVARGFVAADLVQAAETARLQAAFDDAEVPAIFLKGATVGVLAYNRPGIKQSWDIDLLVREERIMDSLKLLDKLGYWLEHPSGLSNNAMKRFVGFQHEAQLRNAKGIVVELHWRLFNKPILSGVTATSETQNVHVGGRVVRTLREDLLIAFLIGHGQEHGWSRLKWLADLNALLAQRSAERLEYLYASAEALGLGSRVSAAFLLCSRLFDLQLSPDLLAKCRKSHSAQRLVAVSLDCIAHPLSGGDLPGISRTNLALLASRFRHGRDWRNFLAELRVLWTEPGIRAKYPRELDIVYHVMRIPMFLLRLPLKLKSLAQATNLAPATRLRQYQEKN